MRTIGVISVLLILFNLCPQYSASTRKARWVDSIYLPPRSESGQISENSAPRQNSLRTEDEVRMAHQTWAKESFAFIRKLNCGRVHFTTRTRCFDLIGRSMSSMNVYIADPMDRLLDQIKQKSSNKTADQTDEIADQVVGGVNGQVSITKTQLSPSAAGKSTTANHSSGSTDSYALSGRRDKLTNTTLTVDDQNSMPRRTRITRAINHLSPFSRLSGNIRRKRFFDLGGSSQWSNPSNHSKNASISRSQRARRSFGRVHIVLPNEELKLSHHVDAVVVVDPYPEANFGHLVLIFTVTQEATRRTCRDNYSVFIESTGDCMRFVVQHRCRNMLHRRNRRRNFDHRCEINFIPLVYLDDNASGSNLNKEDNNRPHSNEEVLPKHRQLLTCRTYMSGFSTNCPQLPSLSRNGTNFPSCNPTKNNTFRCQTTREVLRPAASMRCMTFETCDEAVLISGSWNEWTERMHHERNLDRMANMLMKNGFKQESINIFHIDGLLRSNKSNGDSKLQDFHPAWYKPVFRYHIQNLCRSPHCVDTLVIYLNSPAMPDGSALLWDSDGDGMASDAERYTLEELKTDLSNCQARNVHVIADESYSGEMARVLRRSASHRNVAVFSSGRDTEYSYGDEFSNMWSRVDHTNKCMTEVFREARRFSTGPSRPQMQKGPDAQNVNIFGAPCSVTPPFTRVELQENYLGCQKLPSAIWAAKLKYILSRGDHDAPSAAASRFLAGDSTPRRKVLDDANYDELHDYEEVLDFR